MSASEGTLGAILWSHMNMRPISSVTRGAKAYAGWRALSMATGMLVFVSLYAQLSINHDHDNADYQRIIAHLYGFRLATSQGSHIAHYQTIQPAWRGHGNRRCCNPIDGLWVVLRA